MQTSPLCLIVRFVIVKVPCVLVPSRSGVAMGMCSSSSSSGNSYSSFSSSGSSSSIHCGIWGVSLSQSSSTKFFSSSLKSSSSCFSSIGGFSVTLDSSFGSGRGWDGLGNCDGLGDGCCCELNNFDTCAMPLDADV